MRKSTACGGETPIAPFRAQRMLQDADPAGPAAPPTAQPPRNQCAQLMPALVTQGMAHREIATCLVLSRDMATCHTPQSFPQVDVPSHAQPCTWRQHGLTGCAQTTSKNSADCASHACISGRKSFETMC